MTLEARSSPYRLKNAVSVEMPDYLIRNPNVLLRNNHNQLGLSKDFNLKEEQPTKKTFVAMKVNQKFGYHKDTPFFVGDSSTGTAAMEFLASTKAIFSVEKDGKVQANHNLPKHHVVPQKIFAKLSEACTSVENQRKVQLLFSKSVQ
jgi:hypothetical protein